MKIQFEIFQITEQEVVTSVEWGYGNIISSFDDKITILKPHYEPCIFDTMPEAIEYLKTLEKGKYTILTTFENE